MQHNIIHELNVHNHPFNFSFASLATSRSIWRRAELPAPLLSSPAPVTLPQPDPFPFTELLRALLTFAFSCSNSVLKCSRLHLEIVVWSGKSITRMLMVETFYFWIPVLSFHFSAPWLWSLSGECWLSRWWWACDPAPAGTGYSWPPPWENWIQNHHHNVMTWPWPEVEVSYSGGQIFYRVRVLVSNKFTAGKLLGLVVVIACRRWGPQRLKWWSGGSCFEIM